MSWGGILSSFIVSVFSVYWNKLRSQGASDKAYVNSIAAEIGVA